MTAGDTPSGAFPEDSQSGSANQRQILGINAPVAGSALDKRVYWRSRRGMAELEQQLLPFVVNEYPRLSAADKADYQRLIEAEDWEIFDWFQGKTLPVDEALASLVDRIREFGTLRS